jgi:anaerobic selenocysteine-containing dehydrogenase
MEMIVVDPRRTDLARRASLYLQPVPGEDSAILACLINVIIADRLYDKEFVNENVDGFGTLASSVERFTPDVVAARADLRAEDLIRCAHVFGGAKRGYAAAGVGPGFSSSSTLVNYLILAIDTICGHFLRAGERVQRTVVLMPRISYKAQASPPSPAYGFGERMRIGGLTETSAGLPTGVLADEILLPGDGQVRALISCCGNPVGAWPDQLKTIEAMNTLDLLVQIDPWMSSTARLAHYVVAPTLPYEVPGATLLTDSLVAMPHWYGPHVAYGQYTPALIEPPEGSDVIEEWQFFYGLAQRMGLSLRLGSVMTAARSSEVAIDMHNRPTTDDLIELMTYGSRIPLEEVKRHPHGASFVDPPEYVGSKDPGWSGRLDVGNEDMMRDLSEILTNLNGLSRTGSGSVDGSDIFPFRLIGRRVQRAYNSSQNFAETNRGRGYNPAYMHPSDIADLGLRPGDAVDISSRRATIPAVVEADATLRRGLISMTHGFGGAPERDEEFRVIGSPTSRLLDNWDFVDPYVGMPRMGNVPVAVRRRGQLT